MQRIMQRFFQEYTRQYFWGLLWRITKVRKHARLKSTYCKGYYIEVTSLTCKNSLNFNTKLVKENEKLETNIIDLKEYIYFLENSNDIIGGNIASK